MAKKTQSANQKGWQPDRVTYLWLKSEFDKAHTERLTILKKLNEVSPDLSPEFERALMNLKTASLSLAASVSAVDAKVTDQK